MNKRRKDTAPMNDYEPIIPNILDKTMMSDTVNSEEMPPSVDVGGGVVGGKAIYPLGKKILIGSLIVAIIILVIILMYQLYLYFAESKRKKELANKPPDIKNKPPDPRTQEHYYTEPVNKDRSQLPPRRPPRESPSSKHWIKKQQTIPKPNERFIPEHIRDLDDDALRQYVKAPKQQHSRPNVNEVRQLQQQSLTENVVKQLSNSDLIDQKELEQLQSMCDETFIDDELSRGDMLDELKKEMDEDVSQGELADLEIEDRQGCQHIMVSCRRKGERCGKSVVSGGRCSLHKYK